MSLVIAVYVREGIVLASDSRLSLDTKTKKGKDTILHLSIGMSDANYKTFLTKSGTGISTYGAADIAGVPLAGFIESLISEQLTSGTETPEQICDALLAYFGAMPKIPKSRFIVAGYEKKNNVAEQQVWEIILEKGTKRRTNKPDTQGATWGGETDVLTRLIQPLASKDGKGNYNDLPVYALPWQFFTLQDAIDFAIYAIRSTTDSMRFQNRAKSVGGPIDVLVLKPESAFWVQKKKLHGEEGPTASSSVL